MIMLDKIKFKTDEEIAAYEQETFKKERQAILDKITPTPSQKQTKQGCPINN